MLNKALKLIFLTLIEPLKMVEPSTNIGGDWVGHLQWKNLGFCQRMILGRHYVGYNEICHY